MQAMIRIIILLAIPAWFWHSGAAAQPLPVGKGAIQQLAYSPDGTLLAVADDSAEVWLYDVRTLTALAVLQGHTRQVFSVVFSPDGKLLASAGWDKTIRLWDLAQRKAVGVLEGHASTVTSAAFSPDGKLLASGSWDKTVRLWDVEQQKELAVLKGHTSSVTSVAFSPDGKILASGDGGRDKIVHLWDVEQQKEIGTLEGHTGGVSTVTFSPDGKLLASGSLDKTVRLWDMAQRQEVAALNGHTDKVNAVAFSPNGKILASASADSTIRVWDVEQHTEIATLRVPHDGVPSVAFSPDGAKLASGGGGNDDTVRLWEVPSYREIASFRHRFGGYLLSSTVYSPALVGNPAGDPDTRPYGIYLPHSYDASDRRYPVIYYLSSGGSSFREGFFFKSTIDRMIRKDEIGEMLVVFVDATSKLDSFWYRNSPEFGDYETYITRDLVDHIDATYRTIPHRDSRGVTGYSTGGYGALHLSLTYPEVFSVAVAQASSYSWGVVSTWKAEYDLMNDLGPYANQQVRLNGTKLVHGRADEFVLVYQARAFDQALTDLGINHIYVEHGGGHDFLPEESLQFLSDHLSDEIPTAVLEEHSASLPQSFSLSQNFPNPFNSSTAIQFELPQSVEVELAIYNLAGQQVATLLEGRREAGAYTLRWDGRDERGKELASGVYLYRLRAGERVEMRKLLLLR